MGLDLSLRETRTEVVDVFDLHLTHNLAQMADAAGLHLALWHPERLGISTAGGLVDILVFGLDRLKADPKRFRAMNPPNGFGRYENLIRAVEGYLIACRKHPDARIDTSV